MSRPPLPSCKLITTKLALVGSIASVWYPVMSGIKENRTKKGKGVEPPARPTPKGWKSGVKKERKVLTRTHMTSDMLRTRKGGLANGTFVVTSHYFICGEGRGERMTKETKERQSYHKQLTTRLKYVISHASLATHVLDLSISHHSLSVQSLHYPH